MDDVWRFDVPELKRFDDDDDDADVDSYFDRRADAHRETGAFRAAVKREPATPAEQRFRRRSMSVNDVAFAFSQSSLASKNASSVADVRRYVPTAEAIYRLQKDTPERFHTRSRIEANAFPKLANRPKPQQHATVPHSPRLLSKTRNRPVHFLSQKQLEELEVERIRAHRIRAHPISQAALEGRSNLAPVQRRPPTRCEPFQLTETKRRVENPEPEQRKFTARPIPKYVFERREPKRNPIPATKPISPKLTKSSRWRSLEHVARPESVAFRRAALEYVKLFSGSATSVGHSAVPLPRRPAGPCKPIPFSFDERDREREIKRKEKQRRILEDEKRLREFHANPVPPSILKKNRSDASQCSSEARKENKENACNERTFKARAATVLRREPFVPIKPDKPFLEPYEIELTTERRAKERELFNQKLKEKEILCETRRKNIEENEKKQEEKKVAVLRSQMVHKAAPVRHYAPVVIHPSDARITSPKSPKFTHKRKNLA